MAQIVRLEKKTGVIFPMKLKMSGMQEIHQIQKPQQVNTSVSNMTKLIESLGSRLEKIEQNVPNFRSMQDFPPVEENRAKQKVA